MSFQDIDPRDNATFARLVTFILRIPKVSWPGNSLSDAKRKQYCVGNDGEGQINDSCDYHGIPGLGEAGERQEEVAVKLSLWPQVASAKGPLRPQGQARVGYLLDRRSRRFDGLEQWGEKPDALRSPYPYGVAAGKMENRGP